MVSASPLLRLGTRASPLAVAQAHLVRRALCDAHGWDEAAIAIIAMTASGDRVLDRALADVGGKALWTKELDRALLDDAVDFTVHSMKDVETIRPAEIQLTAILPRADVRDRLIGAVSIESLRQGARVGTSSPRRTAQLLNLRPDLKITLFRGNVATRLAKLEAGDADATLLAAAGLDRLAMRNVGSNIPIGLMLPAPAQGAVGVEIRTADAKTAALIGAIDDPKTHRAILAERAFLAALSADCRSPVAALAYEDGDDLILKGQIFAPDGREMVSDTISLLKSPPSALAQRLLDDASPDLRQLFGV